MNFQIFVVALVAASRAATLDRRYLPPSSSQYAGGPPGSLQTPFFTTRITGFNQGPLQTPFGRTSDNNPSQGSRLPPGSYENEHQGVVVDAAAPGTRASNQLSGLGGPRENYGSTDSKVGEAAFRGTKNQPRPNDGFQSQTQFGSFHTQGSVGVNNQEHPDLSAFYQPTGQVNTGYRPENQLFTDRVSNIVKYHMRIGLNKFNYGYETENGIKMEENGVSNDGVNTQGGYSYTGNDGKVYSVVYTAGKDGYRPMGSHLPTPPPIPAEILESLQQNARDEANGIKDDGSYDAQKYNAEDDYTQSDTNSNNDRQSNKFGKRPGFNAGAGAVINQNQQGFASPNVQGYFSSYEMSKNPSSTQPDTSKFGTVVSGDNKSQSNKVERPGFNAIASTFFNQDQQGYVRPNVQNQFNSNDFTKDPPSRRPDTSNFGAGVSGSDYTSNIGNILAQTGQTAQFDNRFGAQFQYLPPRPPGNFLDANSFLQIDSSKVGFNNNFNNAQPHSEQKVQNQGSNGKPILTITKPSTGTSNGQESSNYNSPPSIQGSNSFGINSNNNRPQNDGAYFQSGIQSSLVGSNLGLEFGSNAQNSPFMYGNGSLPISGSSQENVNNKPQNQGSLSTPIFNVGVTSQNNFNNSPQNQGSFSQIGDGKKENKNSDLSNRFSTTFSSQTIPTKQPDLILTTPVQEQQTDSGSSIPVTSSIYSQPQKPYSINSGNSQPISSSNEKPSEGQFNSNLPGQVQGPDNSYIYNKPSKPFNTYQGATGSNKYPQPSTSGPITPTLPTLEDETEKNTFQTNGITQASISSFPSITPTSSSQTNSGEVYEYTKPIQGFPSSSQEENAGELNPEMNQQSLVPSSQNEGTIKPQVSLESNTQFSQRFPTPSTSVFGQQITPSRFSVQTTLGQKPSQSKFSEQGTSSFGQIPTLSPALTSSPFGQKPTQQQFSSQTTFAFGQQTTPPRFTAQTSAPFGQKQTVSLFDGQTSASLNQQTIPMRFGTQTSPSFGQIPTQPQTSFSFGQQTTPSRFGGQTSSSFGQQPTLSSFGTQTTSSFGQTQTQPQTSFSFGQQTTPSRFGTQTSSTFGQNPSQPQTGMQTSFSFGTQTTPSRLSVQTGSSFGQKPALSPFSTSLNKQTTPSCCSQTSSSFGQQTIPSRFGTETSSTFGQKPTQSQLDGQTSFSIESQTTPSRFGTQTNSLSGQQTTPTRFGEQTSTLFEQKTTPSLLGTQTGSSFGQQTTPSRFTIQSSSVTGQQTTPTPFGEQSSSTFGQKITTAQYFDSSSEQLSTTQIGVDFNKKHQSQSQESNEQSKDQSDSKQSTLQPSTFNLQNSQESVENTSSDEIYQYNKPTTSFTFNQQSQGSTQSSQQPTTQADEQSFSSTSNNKDASLTSQQPQVTLFPRFPEQSKVTNSPFETGPPTTNQFVTPTTSEQSYDSKESTNSDFSSTSHNAQYQPSTVFPKLPNSQNSFNLQKQDQSQISQSGEVYQYNKPAQSLPDSSPNKLDTTKPITSHLSQSNEKFDNVQSSTQSDENVSQTQTDSESQTPSTSTLGTLPSSHPFPQLSFYSACCRGPKPQNGQASQSLSGKFPSSPSTGNLGGNSFGFNKNDNQDTNGSGLKENKFGNQDFGVQKDTPSFVGKGEEFGGPREPPKFDETGYHY